jgi:NitT/TauT family transport system substrate-binding protein
MGLLAPPTYSRIEPPAGISPLATPRRLPRLAAPMRNPLRLALRGGCLLAAAFAALGIAPARAQISIKFSLDGPIQGPEAIFLLPQDKGYFRAAGLNVTIDEAASALEPINRVASGGYELGVADLNGFIRYRDQHPAAPLKAIFMVYNKPPYAVVARRSRGISEPKQLENKKVGAQATGSTFAQWPLFAKLNNIDVAKVSIESIAVAVRAPMLAAAQIDAALGASFRLYVDVKERGVPIDDIVLMRMADYGLQLYGSAIVVNAKFAADNPEAVKAFVQVFIKSLKETIRRPAEAVEAILRRDDAAQMKIELERLRMALRENIVTAEVRADGLGAVERGRLEQSLQQLALMAPFKTKPNPEDIFDPSFLPPLAERKVN